MCVVEEEMVALTGVTLESLRKILKKIPKDQKSTINRSARITDLISTERLKSNNHRNKNHHVSYLLQGSVTVLRCLQPCVEASSLLTKT